MDILLILILLVIAVVVVVWLAPLVHQAGAADDEEVGSDESEEPFEPPKAVELPIEGSLDLHTFSPKEVGRLVPEWLDVCHSRGMTEVRVIHGKGKGVLRRQVHKILDGHPAVDGYELAGHGRGSWGATIVRLKPRH